MRFRVDGGSSGADRLEGLGFRGLRAQRVYGPETRGFRVLNGSGLLLVKAQACGVCAGLGFGGAGRVGRCFSLAAWRCCTEAWIFSRAPECD